MATKPAVRIGVCGTGSFGRRRAAIMDQTEGAAVTLGWSRSAASRAAFEREVGVRTVEEIPELLASPDVDAVMVCSTETAHFPHALSALSAGKHVLVEIPLAMSATQATQLAQLAAERSLVLHHGIQWRHRPDHAQTIEQIRRVGPLLHGIENAYWNFGPERSHHSDLNLNAGGRDFLAFFMPRWMEAFGEVSSVTGERHAIEHWAAASITMKFSSGGFFTVSYALGDDIHSRDLQLVVGREGILQQRAAGEQVVSIADSEHPVTLYGARDLAYECSAFRDEILGKRDHRVALHQDLRALELVDAALPPVYPISQNDTP